MAYQFYCFINPDSGQKEAKALENEKMLVDKSAVQRMRDMAKKLRQTGASTCDGYSFSEGTGIEITLCALGLLEEQTGEL